MLGVCGARGNVTCGWGPLPQPSAKPAMMTVIVTLIVSYAQREPDVSVKAQLSAIASRLVLCAGLARLLAGALRERTKPQMCVKHVMREWYDQGVSPAPRIGNMKGSGGQRELWKQDLEEAQDEYAGRTHSVCGWTDTSQVSTGVSECGTRGQHTSKVPVTSP